MKRMPLTRNLEKVPAALHPYLRKENFYDSSCAANAKVIFMAKDDVYFLKIAVKDLVTAVLA
jgi:aminoglycoside phosphotransferase